MIQNYLKIAFRNLIKFKAYSLINILGLATGTTACLLILLYVQDELSFDLHHKNVDRIYRVYADAMLGNNKLNFAVSSAPMGAALVQDYPEVENYVRLQPSQNMLIRYEDKVFTENRFLWADSTLFDVFTIPVIEGDPKTALTQPHYLVLTESSAKKYFGEEDPIEKNLIFENGQLYKVTAVVEDCKPNSHFHYDMIASMTTLEHSRSTYWISNNFYTYVLFKEGYPAGEFEKKLPDVVKKYVGPQMAQAMGVSFEKLEELGNKYDLHIQALKDIHLKSALDYELEPNGNIEYVYIFSIIAVFILLIACINFMNLATARSSMRSKEVGIRKVLGSNIYQLVRQFLTESVLLSSISVILAVTFVELLLPLFNQVSGKELETAYFTDWNSIPMLLLIAVIVGIIAGSYPAFYLSHFQPIEVLKGKSGSGKKSSWLRSGLVVFQFSISIILFVGTIVVYNQLNFVREKRLGFDKEHVLVIERSWGLESKAESFRNELLNNPNIISASNSGSMPGEIYGQTVFQPEDKPAESKFPLSTSVSGYGFDKTLGIELSEGRYFSKEFPSDTSAIIINETAVKLMNLTDPVGKRLLLLGPTPEESIPFTIIGVVKDFHFESLHQSIRPLTIFFRSTENAYTCVRLKPGDIAKTVSFIESKWEEFVPDKPFIYYFLDESFDQLYRTEQRTGEIFTAFSVLAIFIACLGLFGLAAFTAERRSKEIGIRKVLGATTPTIVYLLSKDFTRWVLLANIIAWPVAYYITTSWLEQFAYRISPNVTMFIIAGLLALLIAISTVSYQAIKVAVSNPVDALRNE
ncbi:MAG: ABC transporter permease [Ignavibacteriales bacterium]|nr:MAG: ABC transporter permease [Ignavibacteriales bacterium]